MPGLTYVCAVCGHRMQTDLQKPAEWGARWLFGPNPALRHLCEKCGCFSVPEELRSTEPLNEERNYGLFSNCPNAYTCAQLRVYDPECERGAVTLRCFLAIHRRLDQIHQEEE